MLIGELTYRLVRDAVEVEPVEPLELKGKAERVAGVPVARGPATRGSTRPRDTTPMVGRDREMAPPAGGVRAAAVEDRALRTVTVVGDAGVGKSRLIHEFLASIAGRRLRRPRPLPVLRPGDHVLAARGDRPQAAGIDEDDPPEPRAGKHPRAARRRRESADRHRLGDRPDRRRRSRWPSCSGPSGGWSRSSPSAARSSLVFDDIHWAEPTLLDLSSTSPSGEPRHAGADPVHGPARAARGRAPTGAMAPATSAIVLGPLDADRRRSDRRGACSAQSGIPTAVRRARHRGGRGQPAVRRAARLDARRRGRHPPGRGRLATRRRDRRDPRPADDPGAARRPPRPARPRGAGGRRAGIGHRPRVPGVGGPLARARSRRSRRIGRPPGDARSQAARPPDRRRRSTTSTTLPLPPHPHPRRRLQRRCSSGRGRRSTSASSRGPTRVNADRDRELEFEEILGYHLEQAHRYLAELGPLDEHGVRSRHPRLGTAGRRPGDGPSPAGDMPASANLLRRAGRRPAARAIATGRVLIEAGEALNRTGELATADEVLELARSEAATSATRRSKPRPASGSIYLHYLTEGDEPEAQVIAAGPGRDRRPRGRRRPARAVPGLAHPDQRPLRRLPLPRRDRRRGADDRPRAAGRRPRRWSCAPCPPSRPAPSSGRRRARTRSRSPSGVLAELEGDRKSEAYTLRALANLEAMRGRFDEARALVSQRPRDPRGARLAFRRGAHLGRRLGSGRAHRRRRRGRRGGAARATTRRSRRWASATTSRRPPRSWPRRSTARDGTTRRSG